MGPIPEMDRRSKKGQGLCYATNVGQIAVFKVSMMQVMVLRVIIPGEDEGGEQVGGVHKRPPIPDETLKAECPKFMSHGPCGGVRKGGFCEVYPEMRCPWISLFLELEKIGRIEWMKQV